MENKKSHPIKSIAFYTFSGNDALAVLRVLGPAQQLGLKVIIGIENGRVFIENVHAGDVVVLQRDFCMDLDSYEKILSLARDLHKPVILDLDDLLFELPEDHPDRVSRYFVESLMPMLRAVMEVDLITVATSQLRDYLLPYNKNIAVIPNYLNDNIWKFKEPTNSIQSDNKVTIGYMGGHSHYPDLLFVLPALLKIAEKYPQEVQFHFWGIKPPPELIPYSLIDWYPPESLEYGDFVSYFLSQYADIMIAPLCDNLFNSCKSPIKYLEYSAFGSPGVYSRVAPYKGIVSNGKDGFLASSTDDWLRTLSKLIENNDLRRNLTINAQQKVKRNWLLSQNAQKQLHVYSGVVSRSNLSKDESTSFYQIVKSFSHQFHEDHTQKKLLITEYQNTIKSLSDQLAEPQSIIDSLTIKISEQQSTIASLSSQISEQQSTINSLTSQLAENKSTIDSLNDQLEHHKTSLDILNNQLSEHNTTIDFINDQLAEHKSIIEALEKQLSQIKENNHILSAQLADLEEEILSYALSKSWTLTRPFRILSRKSLTKRNE